MFVIFPMLMRLTKDIQNPIRSIDICSTNVARLSLITAKLVALKMNIYRRTIMQSKVKRRFEQIQFFKKLWISQNLESKGPATYRRPSGMKTNTMYAITIHDTVAKSWFMTVLYRWFPFFSYQIIPSSKVRPRTTPVRKKTNCNRLQYWIWVQLIEIIITIHLKNIKNWLSSKFSGWSKIIVVL